jgi:predicted negative regulator of RcsB-dependent stress response
LAHISRKELKKDEIRETFEHGAEAVLSHQKILGIVITVVVFALVAVFGWRFYSERQTGKASVAYADAIKVFQARIRAPGEAADPTEPTYLDEKNKFEDALKKFDAVARDYPRTRPGQTALYYSALCQEHLGNYNQAAEALQKLTNSSDDEFAALARFQLASVEVHQGKTQDAVLLYRQLAAKPTIMVPKPLVLLSLGDALAKSNPQEAIKIFNDLKKDFPESGVSDEADKRLEALAPKT